MQMTNDLTQLEKEDKQQQLAEMLEEMDVPDFRKNLSRLANIRWLWRNLLIRNRNHPKAMQAVGIARVLMREKREQNQRVVTMPAIPED
jgi:hypothetical protein